MLPLSSGVRPVVPASLVHEPAPCCTSHANRPRRRACRFQRRRITGSVYSSRAQARDVSQASARHLAGEVSGRPRRVAPRRTQEPPSSSREQFGAGAGTKHRDPGCVGSLLRAHWPNNSLKRTVQSLRDWSCRLAQALGLWFPRVWSTSLRRVAPRTPTAAAAAHAVFNGGGSPVRLGLGGRRHETSRRHQRDIWRVRYPAARAAQRRAALRNHRRVVGSSSGRARAPNTAIRVA